MKLQAEQIVTALATTTTIKAAAEQLSISESTLYKRLHSDTELKALYGDYCNRLAEETAKRLLQHNITAVDVLAEIMQDQTAPVHDRIKAATYILDNTVKYTHEVRREQDFNEQRERDKKFTGMLDNLIPIN